MDVLVDARISRTWHAGVGRYTCSLLDALATTPHVYTVLMNDRVGPPPLLRQEHIRLVRSAIRVASARQHLELPLRLTKYRPDVVFVTHPLATPLYTPA